MPPDTLRHPNTTQMPQNTQISQTSPKHPTVPGIGGEEHLYHNVPISLQPHPHPCPTSPGQVDDAQGME